MSNIYYHNPKCSKSRAGLDLLNQKGIDFTIKEYLKEPLSSTELAQVFNKLNMLPSQVVRTKEDIYKELDLANKTLTDQEWIQVIIDNPKLLERPIFVTDNSAVIGRPTEELENFLNTLV